MNRFFVPLLLVLLANTEPVHAQYRQPAPFEAATHRQEALAPAGLASPYQAVFLNDAGPHAAVLLELEERRRWWVYMMVGAAAGAGTVLAAIHLPFSPWHIDESYFPLFTLFVGSTGAVFGGLIGTGVYLLGSDGS